MMSESTDKEYVWRRGAISETPFSLIKRIARQIRYQSLDSLIDETVSASSIDSIESEIQAFIQQSCPDGTFSGPPRSNLVGTLTKYGILDLEFRMSEFLLVPELRTGIRLLKELGYLPRPDKISDAEKESNRGYLEGLDESIDEDGILLKVFLIDPNFQISSDRILQVQDHSRIPFPIEFSVVDACVTNSGYVWINKHFYL